MTAPLLHLTSPRAWRDALQTGSLHPDSLQSQGFVHLSTAEQIAIPANAVFAGVRDALLLCVDPVRAPAEIRFEPGRPQDPPGMLFPHLYGPIPTAAVIATVPYRAGADGRFGTPTGVPAIDDAAARAEAFVLSHLRRRAPTETGVDGGFAVRDPRFPASYDNNALVLTEPPRHDVEATADRVLDGLAHRRIVLTYPGAGRTASALAERGWEVDELVRMALRPADHRPHAGARRAEQVEPRVISHLWRRSWPEAIPDVDDETLRQLLEREQLNDAVVRVHDLASFSHNLPVAGAQIRIDGATAALDSVLTLRGHRGSGHAGAAVHAALGMAWEARCDLVVLEAAADDWPSEWYARLGFSIVGRSWLATRRTGAGIE